ncbi:MAG: hypothetical protein PUD07_03370 [bacterium]|nr:hypothetical protein [bacterium]
MLLKDDEMIKYTGGVKFTASGIFIISVISTFFLGIIDGFSNPKACNIR